MKAPKAWTPREFRKLILRARRALDRDDGPTAARILWGLIEGGMTADQMAGWLTSEHLVKLRPFMKEAF